MSQPDHRSLEMLAAALEMEKKGKEFYDRATETCRNELGREVFQLLGDYEIKHLDRIRQIHESLEAGQTWSEGLAVFKLPPDLGRLFRRLAQQKTEHIRADTGDLEALGVGIDFESASVKFYEDQLRQAAEPLEKKFLELMAAEEREHLKILTDMRQYYTDPESWFMEKDRISLDGA